MAYHPGVGVVVWRLAPPHSYSCPVYWTQFDKILLTVQKVSSIIILERVFGYRYLKGGKKMLRKNEKELFDIISENDKPEQAAIIAVKVFAAFLAQLEADQEPQPVCLRESS